MKKTLRNYGGIILFYAILLFGVVLLGKRIEYLNQHQTVEPVVISESELAMK